MSFGFNGYIHEQPFPRCGKRSGRNRGEIVAMERPPKNSPYAAEYLKNSERIRQVAKPSALMGAFYAQMNMKIPAIGGKDSMSGTFEDLDVPPTLVAFAVCTADVTKVLSPEFKKHGSHVVLINIKKDSLNLPDFSHLDRTYSHIHELVNGGKILSISSVKSGGIAETISKMAFGNDIGFKTGAVNKPEKWFSSMTGNLILEIPQKETPGEILAGLDYEVIGVTTIQPSIIFEGMELNLEELKKAWESPLESIFPTRTKTSPGKPRQICFTKFVPVLPMRVWSC